MGEGREAVGEDREERKEQGGSGWRGRLPGILEVPAQGALLAQGGSQPSPQAQEPRFSAQGLCSGRNTCWALHPGNQLGSPVCTSLPLSRIPLSSPVK